MRHRLKWDGWRQRDAEVEFLLDGAGERELDEEGAPVVAFDPLGPDGRNGRETSSFVGIINKADYLLPLGRITISPKVNEARDFLAGGEGRYEYETFMDSRTIRRVHEFLVREAPTVLRFFVGDGVDRRPVLGQPAAPSPKDQVDHPASPAGQAETK